MTAMTAWYILRNSITGRLFGRFRSRKAAEAKGLNPDTSTIERVREPRKPDNLR